MVKSALPVKRFPLPVRIFLSLLAIITMVETAIMSLMPILLPDASENVKTLVDALALAALSAPFIWTVIIAPLRTETTRLGTALEHVADAVLDLDEQGRIGSLNPGAQSMFGYTTAEARRLDSALLIPEVADFIRTGGRGEAPVYGVTRETTGCRKDGVCFPLEVSVSRLLLDGGTRFIAIAHDITERKEAENLLAAQKEFSENLLQNSAAPTFVVNPGHRVIMWNKACEELTGVKAEEIIGAPDPWKAFYDQEHPLLADIVIAGEFSKAAGLYTNLAKSSFISGGLQASRWYRKLNGKERFIKFSAAPIRDRSGRLIAAIETLEDITEMKRYEERLEYQANHDELTNLPNRNLLADRLRQALLAAVRARNEVAVISVDLDNFKIVNDGLGHDQGDALLGKVAERIAGCVRGSDTVARQGGDEFVIVIADHNLSENIGAIVAKILQAVAQPVRLDEHELVVTCSAGVSIYPRDGSDLQTLIRNADTALFRAKEQGRNTFSFFTGEMNALALARMTMEKHLRRALKNGEFAVWYQPKVSLRTGSITGMEALVRWRNPELGMVPPSTFIPLAEETGLIDEIGELVLTEACTQNKAWQDAGLPKVSVAVNLSVRQMRKQSIGGTIALALRKTGLKPEDLEIEVTESILAQDMDNVAATLAELKHVGVRLSIDDFGTGYSNLGYIAHFPFDRLKIDQSFVRDTCNDPAVAAIVRATIAMSHSLGLTVVAEGVEKPEQLEYLRSQGCDEMQGYYFSPPVPADDFEKLLREEKRITF